MRFSTSFIAVIGGGYSLMIFLGCGRAESCCERQARVTAVGQKRGREEVGGGAEMDGRGGGEPRAALHPVCA